MQMKKKVTGRNSDRVLASPKASRQKKVSENVQIQEKKVTDLITSSARKKKCDGTFSKIITEHTVTTSLDAIYAEDDTSILCYSHNDNPTDNNDAAMSNIPMGYDDGTVHCMGVADTIFSPTFHISKSVGEMDSGVDFIKACRRREQQQQSQSCGKENLQIQFLNAHFVMEKKDCSEEAKNLMNLTCPGGSHLSPEVSAIYVSMKNSNLECFDEYNQDHMSANVCREDDDYEEYDDFDPYFFVKNLPDLLTVVPAFRPVLLPKQTRSCPSTTLVLDLDETLVHSTLEPCNDADFRFSVNFNMKDHSVFVRCRPFLKDFMERVSSLFEIIIFTASQSIYAEQLLNVLDPKRKIFRHRVYRESCVFVEGNYLKDLSVLGRDLARVIIIDNSPQSFGFQVNNGIPIESWFDDHSDKELLLLLPFLENLVDVEDVRPLIAQKFNLREKIAAAVCPLNFDTGNPFAR